MEIELNHHHSSSTWIKNILNVVQHRSNGKVEHHLVGAALQSRYKNLTIENKASTPEESNFVINQLIYYISTYPSQGLIRKCAENILFGLHPILLLPVEQKIKAQKLVQDEGIENKLTVISLEDFFAMSTVELAIEKSKDPFTIFKELVQIYNKRLEEVETDLSLQIEIK